MQTSLQAIFNADTDFKINHLSADIHFYWKIISIHSEFFALSDALTFIPKSTRP